ncbi:MAG: carboxypeptidase regulatory-like domain-containing protein [Acidobacteria bacterium]|nr:carboxypeptidase regulatory-like domain-containing protein [Acidobacteriota bacterium]
MISSNALAQQTGVVEGRIVNGTDPAIVAGNVPVEVVALSGGMSIIRAAETNSGGEFRIEGLPVDQMLIVRAVYKEANYHTQIIFDDSGRANVEIKVFEATTSMKDIRVEEYQMVFQATGNHLQSLDTAVINNETKPTRTFMDPEGNFRFSKAPEIMSLPQIRISAPGSSMPVVQSVLESPDGQSYYSLYPLRPGRTTVDVFQILPYENRNYTYVKKFYFTVPSIEIGVIPMDMELSGTGLVKIRTDPGKNIAVYRSGPVDAGTEVEWIFSGGTPVSEQEATPASESRIRSVPNAVGRNTLVIGPLILVGFILVLWYAFNRTGDEVPTAAGSQKRQILKRRENLLDRLADLDRRHETHSPDQREYLRQREEGKRLLRRITLLLKKE